MEGAGSGQDENKRSVHEGKGRARFCSFGAVWECAKRANATSPTAHNAFFLQARPQKKL